MYSSDISGYPAADERQRLRHVLVHVRRVLCARRGLHLHAGAHALPAAQGGAGDPQRPAAAVAADLRPAVIWRAVFGCDSELAD